MALLNRDELLAALTRLGQLAQADGEVIELLVVGGGVMVLEFGARLATHDLDGIVINRIDRRKVRLYAETIAREKAWPDDWLRDYFTTPCRVLRYAEDPDSSAVDPGLRRTSEPGVDGKGSCEMVSK
jgi:hypothetical protein